MPDPLPIPPDPFPAAPGPFFWNVQRVGMIRLETGDTVPLVRFVAWVAGARTVGFLTGPDAATMADNLRTAAGGLQVATELPPDPMR